MSPPFPGSPVPPERNKPFLVVPLVETGRGGGHLARCAALVREARTLGREAFLFPCGPYVSAPPPRAPAFAPLLAGIGIEIDPSLIADNPAGKNWDFIVLDRFQSSRREYRFWSSLGPLIGIDEGGPCRDCFDFLIDLLPGPPGRSPPNILDPGLLPLPVNSRPPDLEPAGPLRVLISFGAEDHARLGEHCAAALCSPAASPGQGGRFNITLIDPRKAWVQGGRSRKAPVQTEGPEGPQNITVLPSIPSLGEHLAGYDILITHFGLTAFEALHAGVPVLLVSPGPYHQRLAVAAGFISAGAGVRAARRLREFLSRDWRDLREYCRSLAHRHKVAGENRARLADLIVALRPGLLPRRCPCCGDSGADLRPVTARFPNRIFRRCPRCGVICQGRIDEPPIEYERAYFFELYKKQYGKTYIEDFPNLTAMAEQRLGRILPLLGESPGQMGGAPKLLDIGCAYGAFLLAASRSGFDVRGLDPAEDAAAYVRDTLKLPALRAFFPLEQGGEGDFFIPGSFSVITLWYVIEHFTDPARALEEARRLLKDGGALALSTPSFSGISGKKSLKTFLERSPGDHWTVWNPRICRRILKLHGFRPRKIVVTGHHPERFPLLGRFCGVKGPVYWFLLLLSRIFRLGDTFEVYAVKSPQGAREAFRGTLLADPFNEHERNAK